MTVKKLRILTVVCPLVSLAVAGGLVQYEYAHLARAKREVAAGRVEVKALRDRLKALQPNQPVETGTSERDEHRH